MLDSLGFSAMFYNSSCHIAELNVLNILGLSWNTPHRITSMEVYDPDLDAFESATYAQLQARELGKIKAFICNLGQHSCP